MDRPCKCGGMNEECLYCGGTGIISEKRIEIIKTDVEKSKINKQNSDLQQYLHTHAEKMYVSNNKSIPRKKKPVIKVLKEIKDNDQLRTIARNTSNRYNLNKVKNKKPKPATVKNRKKEVNTKVKSSAELEFLIFWKNNIKSKTKDSHEFQECLTLFLKLNASKREKFKHGIVKIYSSKQKGIKNIALEVYNKLSS